MFEVRLRNAVMFKNVMHAIKDPFESVKWFCSFDGISVYGMDVSHVSVLRLRLTIDAFDKYRCDRDFTFAMKTSSLSKILKYVTNEDMITIRADQRTDRIHVLVEPFTEVEWTQYEIKLIDYNITELDINPDHFTKSATISMPSSKLQRICHDLGQVGDRVTIACASDVVRFFARGEIGTGCVHLYPTFYVEESHLEVNFNIKESLTQTFRLKVLNQLTKATPLTPQVIIHLRTVGPLEIIYNINVAKIGPKGEPNVLTAAALRFYLSPDVEIED